MNKGISFKFFKYVLPVLCLFSDRSFSSSRIIVDEKGEIIGNKNKRKFVWKRHAPFGMVLIPSGTFLMGGGVNQSVIPSIHVTEVKTVGPFYMDETEVTVAQYFAFLDIVKSDPESYGLDIDYINAKLIPDMNSWQRDFGFMFMDDSFGTSYCNDPGFGDRPIVGITFEAAQQFARVRSIYRNKYLVSKGLPPAPDFRLPTAVEWEYAAKGGSSSFQYPWGGPNVRDTKGNLLANFKVTKGNYSASGYTYTSPVKAFPPNGYGLYDMAGNVSEWCQDVYSPIAIYKDRSERSIDISDKTVFRVIKGGSWKDYAYALQTGVCDFENQEVARCYIGFRCVMSAV
uniref:SUMF1/EgtB/PvdO family nonheme iron enzyme n=1 Tax=Cardinium endosymbiont of Bemisia tabaci TaxID=672794 RepID=UPI000442CF0E|nr:SUMF1/EgtB/PvdO family nonheme iron enzyme [Cardinium endosymbiont of Bemisia tabaci]CDG50377.1 Gliding motility protein GldK [Cardinium endosymbiont cBtQ1 of Bemisia tabaci]